MPTWRERLPLLLSLYRVPILVGAGGVVAYAAYSSSQQRARAAAAAAQAAPGGLDPNLVASLIGQGGGLVIAGQAPLVDLAGRGLDVAALGAQAAAGVADVAVGGAVAGTMALADVVGSLAGALITQPAPTPTPTPIPLPILPGPDVFVNYEVWISALATFDTYIVGSDCALLKRTIQVAPGGRAAERGVCNGRVHWRSTAGMLSGTSMVAGLTTGPWAVFKRMRRSDGTTYIAPISQTGV